MLNRHELIIESIVILAIFTLAACERTSANLNHHDNAHEKVETHNVTDKNYRASLTTVNYLKNNPKYCGPALEVSEKRILRKYAPITIANERRKYPQLFLHLAVCYDLHGNLVEALDNAETVVYLADIWDEYGEEYRVALSLIANHELASWDQRAWAFSRLEKDGLIFYDVPNRSPENNRIHVRGRKLSILRNFLEKKVAEIEAD